MPSLPFPASRSLNCGGSGEIFTDFVLRAYYSQKDGANFNQNADHLAEPRTTLNCTAGAVISKEATAWYADVVPYKPTTENAGALKGTVAKPGCALGKKATATVLAECEKKGASVCFINVTQIAADMKTNFPEMKDSTYVDGDAGGQRARREHRRIPQRRGGEERRTRGVQRAGWPFSLCSAWRMGRGGVTGNWTSP